LSTVIQPYRQEHEPAVAEFNRRLRQGTADPNLVFPGRAIPRWLPYTGKSPVWNEFFVAVEEPFVRGAYGLKQEQILFRDKGMHQVACYHHSLSEGIIDKTYARVGASLVRDALARQPLLYVLGMGGFENPLPKMLKALGFSLTLVPFYFRIVHPRKFLFEMNALRSSRWRVLLMNLAAASGTGWLAIKTVQAAARLRSRPQDFVVEEVNEFSSWADDLWSAAKGTVNMAAVRDANTLQILYPKNDRFLTCVRVSRKSGPVGWAVVGERRKDVQKFGQMRVGSIVDCWASPEDMLPVVRGATQTLVKSGVDLIVSNQSHSAWGRALEDSGFLKGPSTFIFAASKKLTELLQPLEQNKTSLHVTRADGDGLPRNF